MNAVRGAVARVGALFRRHAIADGIREELQFHVDMRAQELARDGLDAREARNAALRRFGNPAVIHDRGYDVRGGGVLETMAQDVTYGLRQLRRQPSFSIVAILTLALGRDCERPSRAGAGGVDFLRREARWIAARS